MSDPTLLEETGRDCQYAANWHRLQDKSSRDRSRPSKSASEIIQDLRAFGPGQVPAWADLSNINKLCSQCASIDWDPVRVYLAVADRDEWYPKVPLYGRDISRSVRQVRDAAHAGCHLCTMILTCLLTMRYRFSVGVDPLPWGLPSITDDSLVRVDVEVMAHDPPTYLTIGIVERTDSTNWAGEDEAELHHWVDLSIPFRGEMEEDLTPAEVNVTDSAEKIAMFWLEECLTNHQRCAGDVPLLPTRVVDVGSRVEPFLVIPQGKRARYATLSYSVGQFDLLKTTTETIDEFKTCIPTAKLPQTVKDAVEITRKLGLQFLWIDSLCIDQSSLADWEIELSSMADIYWNSTITIAATASTNAGTGCQPLRNKLPLIPCHPAPGIVIVPDYGRDMWIFQRGALETRAWTFQEVQLARRVLRCGSEELVWQCRSCKRREGHPAVEKRHESEALGVFFGTRTLDDISQRTKGSEKFHRWYQVVQEFVARNLTFAADKLPAFSGMASHFAALLGSALNSTETVAVTESDEQEAGASTGSLTYLCGLWKEDLLHGLVWRNIYPTTKYLAYRAPSWSWAAVEGGKTVYDMYALRSDDFCSELLDVQVTVPGLNPFGRVTCGKLTLLGPLAPVPSQIYGDDSDLGVWEWKWPLLTFDYVDEPPLRSFVLRLQRSCCLILAAVEKASRLGTYRRVGMLVMPTELEDPEKIKLQILDSLDWRQEVVTII
jgi:hypothetical protein